MSIHRVNATRDANELEIVDAFRKCGWLVVRHSTYDLDVCCPRCREILAVEVKMPPETATTPSSGGRLTKNQERLLDEGWPLKIVRTLQDVKRLIWNHNAVRGCRLG